MKWFLVFAAVFALLFSPGVCAPVNAQQHCENGVCQMGPPLVAMPGPFFGPVILQPAPVFVSPHGTYPPGGYVCQPSQCGAMPCQPCHPSPPVVYGCHGPQCRPAPNDWRHNHNGQRSGSVGVGINLNWNRSCSSRYASRWR